jgi:mannonate dehydratase
MKLGLGLYRAMLTPENFQFARQAGATHIVAHLTDYFRDNASLSTASAGDAWGIADPAPWTYEELRALTAAVRAEGLELAALENFNPAHWYDILLDGPRKQEQMEDLKRLIRDMGRVGIGCMGYNFSVAGVWGRTETRARGDAPSVGYIEADAPAETPIPNGQVWNMIYDSKAPSGTIAPITDEQMWARIESFLTELVPVAEEAGVRLALHPDDPPFPSLRGTARLVHRADRYQRVLDIVPSPANGLEFCLGTLAEMPDSDIYAIADHYSKQGKIGYVHCRNIQGKLPNYREVFIDEGDVDMIEVLRILHRNGFDGVVIPDHTPQMACAAPWHAGMAYALGWLRAVFTMIGA